MRVRKKISDIDLFDITAVKNNRKTDIGLKQSLVDTRNAIRKKFQDLHSEKQSLRELVSGTYKPIIDPIKSLTDDKNKNQAGKVISTPTKDEIKNEIKNESSFFKTAYPPYRRKLFPTTTKKQQLSNNNIAPSENISGIENILDDSVVYSSKNYNTDVLEDQIHDKVKQISSANKDDVYGIRQSHNGELVMGKDPVKIRTVNSEMRYCIKNKQFPSTPGLTDLLLQKNPKNYNEHDLDTYKEMLMYTNAHKKNYNPSGAIRKSKSSTKYNEIISHLFPERKSNRHIEGKGVKRQLQLKKPQIVYKTFNKSNAFDYKYWDDPNELVDRLRLLVASQAAGHTGHNNEIISIIEELREAKIIV